MIQPGLTKAIVRPVPRLAAYAVVAVGAALMLMPFYFMFVFASHHRSEIFQLPPPLWFGGDFVANLKVLVDMIPFLKNLGWSLYVATIGTGLTLLFCSMGGYAFAMYQFPGKRWLFSLVMSTMLVPSFLNMIPTFMIMDLLDWIDQPRALYLPGAASAFGIFLMRQFISASIPKPLIEAARMDGCSELRIFFQIVLPLLGPALGTLGMVAFIASWNNFINPLVVMRSMDHYTLPLALRSMQNPVNTEWGAIMAGSCVAVVPLMLMFVFFSRRLIQGLTVGAVK
jgi:multiple sugar transport system permease protein